MSNYLRPHESQHARPPCPSPAPGVHPDSRPSGQWCHPAISSSVIPFSSCPQSLPVSESFPMSQHFAWGGQSTGVSALASFLPKKSQGWSPLGWTGWISLQSKGMSRAFSVHCISSELVKTRLFFLLRLTYLFLFIPKAHPPPYKGNHSNVLSVCFLVCTFFVKCVLSSVNISSFIAKVRCDIVHSVSCFFAHIVLLR